MTNPAICSVRDIVNMWPSYGDMASDVGHGVREHQPRDWARRGRIPAEFIAPVVEAAKRRGFSLTHEAVTKILAAEVVGATEPPGAAA